MKRKEAAILTSAREDGKREGFDELRESESEELNATIDTTVWFPELRM